MKPKQIKCLELMVQGELTDKEIAEAINISPKTICEWKKNNEEFRREYNRMIRSSLQYAAPKAFRKQETLLNSKNEMVAYLAAKDLMDRAGLNPIEKIEANVNDTTKSELQELLAQRKARGEQDASK